MRGAPSRNREQAASAPAGGFSAARLARLSQLEQWHFWFVARRALIDKLLETVTRARVARVLDVGCGTGANLPVLQFHARRVVGFDLRPEGLRTARASRHGDAVFVRGSATGLPFACGAFDVVTVLDVLEHVDDQAALGEIRRVLRPGGAVVVTVPAMPWLWSYRDVDAGHLRRYERRRLIELLEDSGLEVRRLNYYQCLLFPLTLARVLRRTSAGVRDLEEQPVRPVNAILSWISRAEVHLGRFISWPFGSSLVALCRKPEHEPTI